MATKQVTRSKRTPTKRSTAAAAKKNTRAGTKTKTNSARAGTAPPNIRTRAAAGTDFSTSQVTTDPDEIRQWVEERGGYPATVIGTGSDPEEAGILRIDYPGYSGQATLERISWDEFFDKFDEAQLAFLYQNETKDGGPSRFSKLISRDEANTRNNQ